MKKFIFDVDGTLTSPRQNIDSDFLQLMLYFAGTNDVYLVTGSDRDKTLEQVGLDLFNSCKRVYNCSGADVWEKDKNVYRSNWELPEDVERFLQDELDYSSFPIRTGVHIERRPGGVNFSILGRGSGVNFVEREEYVKWDKDTDERRNIVQRLKDRFPELTVQIGGQTGCDISDGNKSQILRDFSTDDEIHFFGDMMEEGQNDYPLAEAVKKVGGYPYNVKDWTDTRTILEGIYD